MDAAKYNTPFSASIHFRLKGVNGGWHVLRRVGSPANPWRPVTDWQGRPYLYRTRTDALADIKRVSRRKVQ